MENAHLAKVDLRTKPLMGGKENEKSVIFGHHLGDGLHSRCLWR
ncbi:hypothetical protein KKC1_18870 [Calderihabitans maritimus]|uniref:Uncharacterized protein n=1 Tax=Calderihabitans maritimus TaxID=1246530 RepID=A0A1Z5HTS6_9FIRM|nr:hypothetical protein KKC1_18870 [Calderihabitans maritimus]